MLIYCDNTTVGRRRFLCGACGERGNVHELATQGGTLVTEDESSAGFFDYAGGRLVRVSLQRGSEHFAMKEIADLGQTSSGHPKWFAFGAARRMAYDAPKGELLMMLGDARRRGSWFARIRLDNGTIAKVMESPSWGHAWDVSPDLRQLWYYEYDESKGIPNPLREYSTGDGKLLRAMDIGVVPNGIEVAHDGVTIIATRVGKSEDLWQRGLWLFDLRTGTGKLVNDRGHDARWRPGSGTVAFIKGRKQLWLADVLNEEMGGAKPLCVVELEEPPGGGHAYWATPSWSANGGLLTAGLSAWRGGKHFSDYEHWGVLVDLAGKRVWLLRGLYQGVICLRSTESLFGVKCGNHVQF